MKRYLYLLIIFLAAFFIILAIYNLGDIPNKYNNGFKRNYFLNSYTKEQEMGLRDTLYEIIGATRSNIYLTTASPGEVLEVNRKLNNHVKRFKIPFFDNFFDSLKFHSLTIKIDSPHIYLFAENKPAIIRTDFDSTLFEIKILPPGPFTREAIVNPDCFILRKFESRLTDQIFVRYDFSTGLLKKEDSISPIYGDGGIVSDGSLHFDSGTKKLCYIYYYKNVLLSFDTSLAGVNKFTSIDTISSVKIRTGLVKNSGAAAYTNISPANVINKLNYVQNGLLFNMSALKADNETDEFFSTNSILDIIDLKNGKYLGSLNFPTLNQMKISQFIISDDRLICLYANSIIIYHLNLHVGRQD